MAGKSSGSISKVIGERIAAHGSKRTWRGATGVSICIVGLSTAKFTAEPYQTWLSFGLLFIGAVGGLVTCWGIIFPEKVDS